MACDESTESSITLYKARDNAVTVVPYANYSTRENYDMTAVVRVTANADLTTSTSVGDAIEGDSDVDDTIVWWAEVENEYGEMEWRIYCKVGMFVGIVAGDYTLRITIYDAAHPNGFVLPGTDSTLLITIVDLP